MKWIAIVDDEFLSNFRIDVGTVPNSNTVLVVKDERGFERGLVLQPVGREMVVLPTDQSVYITQDHIDAMLAMERDKMQCKALHDLAMGKPWVNWESKE